MKRKFLNIISCFLVLFIFVGSFVFCVPSRVSADSFNSLPSEPVYYGLTSSQVENFSSDIFSNSSVVSSGFDSSNCYLFIVTENFSTFSVYLVKPDSFSFGNDLSQFSGGSWHDFPLCIFSTGLMFTGSSSSFSSSPFSSFTSTPSGNVTTYGISFTNSSIPFSSPYFIGGFYYDSNWGHYSTLNYNHYYSYYFGSNYVPPYEDDYLTGFVTGFDYSTQAFVQWLIDTGKYQDLPAYIGTSKLVSFIDFYKQWGSSNKLFVVKILEWMAHFNIGAQSLENRNILKSTIDRLYQEYCNSSYVTFKSNSANNVHHRQNINTKTDDTDLTLVTDDPNDDTITSILRDILRGVIAIPTSIYNNSQAIISKLDSLNWTVNIANDGGSSSGSDLTPVLNKIDDIIDKLEADTVSVEIDQTTKDDTDVFFDDWNLEFSTAINNKFPVASQLRTFFTGFFERCGIDADSDGEVYQYYNPGVLTASTVSRSVGTASEDDIVSDFLGQFDNSDPAFLDDASFHGVPDLSVSVGGQSVSIIDFRVYAKYRDKIHFIISFVIWTLYLLHLYKALPSIIGQVADVATKTSEL